MSQKLLFTINDFSLGLNDTDAPNLIPDNALVDVNNMVVGRGYISSRHGYVRYSNQLGNPIDKIYEFHKNNGTKELIAVSNKSLYKDSSGNLSMITGTLTSNDVKLITYKNRNVEDVVLIADKGKLKVYNGTSLSAVTAHSPSTDEQTDPGLNDLNKLTNFRAIAIKKDRIFAAAHPTIKNRISFTHHDPSIGYAVYDYFPATYFFDVAVEDNDEIVELTVFRDALIIFCKRSVWALYGDGRTVNDYELKKINVPSGCISAKSIQIVGNDIFYLSDEQIYRMYATEENYVSAEIISTVKQTGSSVEKSLKKFSRSNKEKAVGTYFENKYYLSFPDGSCFIFDTMLGSWTKWSNVQSNSFLNKEGVLFFASNTGVIYQFDENALNDDGNVIPYSFTTKNYDSGFMIQAKKYRKLWTIAKQYEAPSSNFNIDAKIDYVERKLTDISTDESFILGEGVLGQMRLGYVDVITNEIRIREKGKNIQLIISNDKLDQPLTLYGLVLQYKLKKP
jgi:hypothetical protein